MGDNNCKESGDELKARIDNLENAFMQTLACLGIQLIKSPDGRLGYKVPKVGPQESWGLLAKILSDIAEIKNEKRIIVPGRG